MITSIFIFILVLSLLVLVHEAGHFFVAKKAGIWVEEFGFGLPPRVIGKKVGETIYSINLLPFGGFVRLHGENYEEDITKPKRAFLNHSKRVRTAIVVAGVVMNFLLAFLCFSIVYSFSGIPKKTDNVKIVDVSSSSPASEAGILVGDMVKSVDGQEIKSTDEFIDFMSGKKGEKVKMVVIQNGEDKTVNITPRVEYPDDQGPLGVIITSTELYYPPVLLRPLYGAYYGFKESLFWGKTVILGFVSLFTDLLHGVKPQDVAGPVGIFALTSEAAKVGVLYLINFVGILSVNLAILNIIPFPALDGGRFLFIVIEAVIGKKVLPKVEAIIHTVGMIILLLLILLITAGDIKKLIQYGGLSGFIDSFMK